MASWLVKEVGMTYRTLVATSMFADGSKAEAALETREVLRYSLSGPEGSTTANLYVRALLQTLLSTDAARIPLQGVFDRLQKDYSRREGSQRVITTVHLRSLIRWILSWHALESVEHAFLRFHDRVASQFEKSLFVPALEAGGEIRETWIGILMLGDFNGMGRNQVFEWIGRCLLGRPLEPHEASAPGPEALAKKLLYGEAQGEAFHSHVVKTLFQAFFKRSPRESEVKTYREALRTNSIESVIHELAISDEFRHLATSSQWKPHQLPGRLVDCLLMGWEG